MPRFSRCPTQKVHKTQQDKRWEIEKLLMMRKSSSFCCLHFQTEKSGEKKISTNAQKISNYQKKSLGKNRKFIRKGSLSNPIFACCCWLALISNNHAEYHLAFLFNSLIAYLSSMFPRFGRNFCVFGEIFHRKGELKFAGWSKSFNLLYKTC